MGSIKDFYTIRYTVWIFNIRNFYQLDDDYSSNSFGKIFSFENLRFCNSIIIIIYIIS